MNLLRRLLVCLLVLIPVAGLAACDDADATVNIRSVYGTQDQDSWPLHMGERANIFMFSDVDMVGVCSLNIPASPIVSGDPTTQIHIPLRSYVTNDATQRIGPWLSDISESKIPPGTYASSLTCSGNKTGANHNITLTPNPNEYNGITPYTFTNAFSQELTVTGTDLGTACTLKVTGDSASSPGTPAELNLPVTLGPPNQWGVVTTGVATWPAGQTTLTYHTNLPTSLSCTGRADTGTHNINPA